MTTNVRKHISDFMYKHASKLLSQEFQYVKEEFHHKDVFGYTENGSSCEIEIKVNDYDFHKEFTKPCKQFKHDHYSKNKNICPTRFYFFIPRKLMPIALERIRKTPWYCNYGLIIYDDFMDSYKIVKKSEVLSSKPFIGEILDVPFKDYKHKRISL